MSHVAATLRRTLPLASLSQMFDKDLRAQGDQHAPAENTNVRMNPRTDEAAEQHAEHAEKSGYNPYHCRR